MGLHMNEMDARRHWSREQMLQGQFSTPKMWFGNTRLPRADVLFSTPQDKTFETNPKQVVEKIRATSNE